jgi:hypothetical protein
MAARIQDVVDVPFDRIIKAKLQENGQREVFIEAKKSTSRNVLIGQETFEAVKQY